MLFPFLPLFNCQKKGFEKCNLHCIKRPLFFPNVYLICLETIYFDRQEDLMTWPGDSWAQYQLYKVIASIYLFLENVLVL